MASIGPTGRETVAQTITQPGMKYNRECHLVINVVRDATDNVTRIFRQNRISSGRSRLR